MNDYSSVDAGIPLITVFGCASGVIALVTVFWVLWLLNQIRHNTEQACQQIRGIYARVEYIAKRVAVATDDNPNEKEPPPYIPE